MFVILIVQFSYFLYPCFIITIIVTVIIVIIIITIIITIIVITVIIVCSDKNLTQIFDNNKINHTFHNKLNKNWKFM
jgi:hypothetical protein